MKSIPVGTRLLPVFLVAGSIVSVSRGAGGPSNILLLISDDLRPDVGCYGDKTALTPNIDRLASQGVLFEQAFCVQALCAPSRNALLTGLRPDTTKVWDVWTFFRKAVPDEVTLPQLLQQHGWFTEAIGKVYHTNLDDPASWSVPHVMPDDSLYGSPATKALLAEKRRQAIAEGLTGVPYARAIRSGPPAEAPEVPDNALVDGKIADLAVAALEQLNDRHQRFFLAVGFTKPHLPYVAPRKYWDLYDERKIPLSPHPGRPEGAPPFALGTSGEMYGYDRVPNADKMTTDYQRWLRHGYLAATSYMDAQVGRVLAELKRLGLAQDTLVIFWGDNGYKLGDYQAWTKTTNVMLDTRIPLIIRAPGIAPAGTRANGLVEVVDIYPTLLKLLGYAGPAYLEGTSFLPLLESPRAHWKRAIFTQSPQTDQGVPVMGYSIVTERFRLTRWVDRATLEREVAVELYDHSKDPAEMQNVANVPAYAAVVKRLKQELLRGWKAVPQPQ